jgi:hypothetical protein
MFPPLFPSSRSLAPVSLERPQAAEAEPVLLCLCGQSQAETPTGPCPEAAPATPGRRPAVVLPSSFISGAKVASPQPRSGPPRRLPRLGSGGDRVGRHPFLLRGWGGRSFPTVSTSHRVSSMPENIRRLHMWHNVQRVPNRPNPIVPSSRSLRLTCSRPKLSMVCGRLGRRPPSGGRSRHPHCYASVGSRSPRAKMARVPERCWQPRGGGPIVLPSRFLWG